MTAQDKGDVQERLGTKLVELRDSQTLCSCDERMEVDANALCEVLIAAPDLLAENRALAARVEKLLKYGDHQPVCKLRIRMGGSCGCGWSDVRLAALAAQPLPVSEPTQRGDETAAKMRVYFEAHKRDRYREGEADSLMIGLLNIVLAEYGQPLPVSSETP